MKSIQKRKQRKKYYTAPHHKRLRFMRTPLSKKLRDKHGKKNLPVRKGDTVRILRGDHTGHEGNVEKVNLKDMYIYVNGVTTKKADGSDAYTPVHPSNIEITKLELKDEERKKIIER